MKDVWQTVKEKIANEDYNSHTMYEQTHHPIAIQPQERKAEKEKPKSKLDAVHEIYRKKYRKRQARKNLV